MTRAETLDAAKKCVMGDRQDDYGTPERNFENIAALWTDYLRAANPMNCVKISPKDAAVMMALMKIARIANGNKEDSFVDLAGYAACAAEIAGEE